MPCAKKVPAESETDAELPSGAAVTHRLERAAHEVRQIAAGVIPQALRLAGWRKRAQPDHGSARGGGSGQAAARIQCAALRFALSVHSS